MKKWFAGILTSSLVFAASLLLIELGLRGWAAIHPDYDVEMWRYGTLLKEKSPDPRMSHRHVPGAHARLYGVEIAINSKGLRDREFAYQKPPGVFRILFLGDSLTLGWGVRLEDIFAKRIERGLSRESGSSVEGINSGVGNYNSEQEWAFYQDEGRKYSPDHVILLYFINDAEPTPVYKSETLKENSMLVVFLWSRLTRILSAFGTKEDFVSYYKDLYLDTHPGWSVAKSSLKNLKEAIAADGGRFTVAVCPELRKFNHGYPFIAEHRKVLDFLEAEKIDYVDLLPAFQDRAPDESLTWVSREDSHPNAFGHEIIAEAILRKLREKGLSPRSR